jgi:hypothetical protein
VHQSGQDLEFSSLLHDSLLATKLALDLLSGPSSGVDRARLELAVGLGLLDHRSQPILSESIRKFTTRVCVGEITSDKLDGIISGGAYKTHTQ